ncbi:MAG: diguanylate cyclase, partial [Mariprofundus sp.]
LQPDVILQDLVMPDVDGMMLVKYYHANPLTRDIPIVVLSSRDEARTKAEAFIAGANDYLVKLPDSIELLARLRYHAKVHASLLERNAALEELKRISITDGLTGLYNRRYFDETFAKEWRRAMRDQKPLSLVMLDVDHFKQFNDHYGHQDGDGCLVQVAAALQGTKCRAGDIVARYGGEEFIGIFTDTEIAGAMTVAEKIRLAVTKLNIPHHQSQTADYVTVSVGVASAIPSDDTAREALIKAADTALYRAKETGRNRVAASDFGSI